MTQARLPAHCFQPSGGSGPLSTPHAHPARFDSHDSTHVTFSIPHTLPTSRSFELSLGLRSEVNPREKSALTPCSDFNTSSLSSYYMLPRLDCHSGSSRWDQHQKNQPALPSECFQNLGISFHLQGCTSCKASHLFLGFLPLAVLPASIRASQ